MSHNSRNHAGERQGNPRHGSDQDSESKNHEGFEGMNYEQRRQPFNPQRSRNTRKDDNEGDGQRRDEI